MEPIKSDSLETRVRILNQYESLGCADGLLSMAKTKIDFRNTTNDLGHDVCQLVATMHLSFLNQELYSLAINAYENYTRARLLDPSIVIEYPIETNGMCYVVLVKDFPARFNDSPKNELVGLARKALIGPLEKEASRLKDLIASPGFPGKSVLSSAPFSCSAIINSIAKTRFFRKLTESNDEYSSDAGGLNR